MSKQIYFFLQSCYSGLLEIAVHCSRIANFIGFKSFDRACFLTFIAFSMLKFSILNENALNHTSHKTPHSLGRPFFFFFSYNKLSSLSLSHLLPRYSIAPPPPSYSGKDHRKTPSEKGKAHSSLKEFILDREDSPIIFCVCHFSF